MAQSVGDKRGFASPATMRNRRQERGVGFNENTVRRKFASDFLKFTRVLERDYSR